MPNPSHPPLWLRVLREPVLHFVLAGAALFLIAGGKPAARTQPTPEAARHIEVTPADLARLQKNFEVFAGRAPRPEELEELVDDYVLDEILVQEALARGLEKNDPQIRQRLREKMEFVLESAEPQREPTQKELETYLAANAEYYAFPAQISFKQVFLSPSNRQEQLQEDANRVLEQLRAQGPEADFQALGDEIPLPAEYRRAATSRLELMFGVEMVKALQQVALDKWQGPLESDFGLHLVYVSERLEPRTATLEEVREAVRREWITEQSVKRQEEAQNALKALYTVNIAPLPSPEK